MTADLSLREISFDVRDVSFAEFFQFLHHNSDTESYVHFLFPQRYPKWIFCEVSNFFALIRVLDADYIFSHTAFDLLQLESAVITHNCSTVYRGILPSKTVQLDCKVRKYRRPFADFNKPKTFLLQVLFLLEHQHLHLYNGPQKSLLKLKIFKKYDKTKVQVLFTVPLQTTACSLELNIQNQTRFGTARKQKFSSFFLRRPF